MTALPSSGTFMMVPVGDVATLGPVAAIVLARIVWRSERNGAWTATRQTIANETGLPLRSVRTALDLLRERSLLDVQQGLGYDRTATWRPVCAGQAQGDDSVPCMVPDSSLGSDESVPFEVTESATSSLETERQLLDPPYSPPASPDGDGQTFLPVLVAVPDHGPDYEEEFAGFWGAWPAGRKVGKPTALRAYVKARKSGTPVEAIAAGLRAHLPAWTARIDVGEAGFVPHPATWLNRAGWEDTPPPMPRAAQGPRNVLLDPHLMDGLGSAIGFTGAIGFAGGAR